MHKRRGAAWALYFGALFLTMGLLLGAFAWASLDADQNARLILSLDGAANTGLNEADTVAAAGVLMDYLKGARADIDMTAPVYGVEQPVYNAREIAHMADVLRLFQLERRLQWTLCGAGLLLLVLGAYLGKSRKILGRLGLWAMGTVLVLAGGFALAATLDFNAVFLWFHSVAFTNDLWLLDPATDLMIRMLPEPFFAAVCLRAAAYMGAAFLGLGAAFAVCALKRGEYR